MDHVACISTWKMGEDEPGSLRFFGCPGLRQAVWEASVSLRCLPRSLGAQGRMHRARQGVDRGPAKGGGKDLPRALCIPPE